MLATAEFFALDDIHILCTKPPRCVLFKRISERKTSFEHLDYNKFLLYPKETGTNVCCFQFDRLQSSRSTFYWSHPGLEKWYRCQGKGLSSQVLHSLCSAFTFNLVCWLTILLQKLEMSDLSGGSHERLLAEMSRLKTLEEQTLANWEADNL